MSTIITRNSATSGSTPSSLVQGELAINVTDGRLFYGSGSSNDVKEFTSISASYSATSSFITASGVYGPYGSNSVISSSYAVTSSYAFFAETASSALNAQDILIKVLNQSGNPIVKGIVVHITASGNSSDIPRIITASYENDNNSANTLGIANETIANGAEGFVMTEGVLKGINTSAFVSGQLIYLGATGSIIGTAPVAPLHSVRLGQVVRQQSNNGSIYVRIDNGYELGELHDVRDTTTTASYGDLLVKSGSIWINSKQLTGSYGLTGSLQATSFTGSLHGTSSWANNASTASYVNPLQQDVEITGSLVVTGSQINLTTDAFGVIQSNTSYLISANSSIGVGINRIDGNTVADFESTMLYDSSTVSSIDWTNRQLIKSDGSTVALDWDFGQAYDSNTVNTLNWESGILNDSNSQTSVDWNQRYLKDTTAVSSIDWQNRQLVKSDGTTVAFDWENGALTSSLYGTASWSENAISSSFSDTASFATSALSASFATSASFAPTPPSSGSFGITIDGAGSTITTGNKGFVIIPYSGTITSWTIVADQSGSCVIDVWKANNLIPTSSNTIAGTEKPTLTNQQLNSDTNLTTWTSSVSPGDIVAFNVDSATTVTRVNLSINVIKQ